MKFALSFRDMLRAALVLAVACPLMACSALLYGDAVKLCRSLTPVFVGPQEKIEIRRVDAERTVHGLLVVVAYTVPDPGAQMQRRAVSCIFREGGPAGRLDLTNLATEDGPVGEVRLHLIKRHWIDKGHAAVSDPSPVALAGFAPDVSRSGALILQAVLSSLSGLGIYALLAAAFALVHGLVGRIHLAFGELAMLGGYGAFLGYWIGGGSTGSLAALIVAFGFGLATAALHGTILGSPIFARAGSRSSQHVLIATLGLSIVWSELARLAQGSGQRWMPPLWSEPVGIARGGDLLVTVTAMGLVVPVLAALLLAVCCRVLAATRFGRHWRAYADDPYAAALMCVDSRRIIALTLALSSLLAGAGGVLMLLAYGGVGHAGGFVIGLKALIAGVIGGIGSVRGAVLGALTVGLAEIAWSHLVGIDSRDLALFVALTLVLVLKPDGLFAVRQTAPADTGAYR